MSIIKNTGIKRGDKLTATELNAEFTSANSAFTMDGDNFRNEAIDQPSLDTQNNNGQSGTILKDANSYTLQSGTLTVSANENADTVAPEAATEIGAQAVTIVAKEDDIFRVYWQYDFNTAGNDSAAPIDVDQRLCWAVWLEWKTSSGGSYAPVTGQGDLDNAITVSSATRYGELSSNMRATSLDMHCIQFRESVTNQAVYPGRRGGYGQYYFKFTGDTTLYGLRLMVRGIYEPVYATTSNAIKSVAAASGIHSMVFYRADLSFLLMRNE